MSEIAEHFQALGFTQLESDIYCFLLANGLSTGYSIAKVLINLLLMSTRHWVH